MKSGNIPYNVMMPKTNDWANVPRGPAAAVFVGSAIFGGGVLTAGQLLVSTILVNFAVSAVTSWALQALAPKPKANVGTQGLLTNIREAAAPHEYVYGEVRKGGVITYLEATGENNKFLHMIVSLAGHELESIDDIYINDEIVTINGSNIVTSSPWNSKIRIEKYLGNQTTAPASLVAESSQVNANFIGRGIAYLYIRLEYDQDVFANGIPLFTAVVKGKKVFDPRTSGTAYSANAALCIRDYLTADYGMGDVGSTDDTIFSAAANVCDEDVDLATAGVQPRYEMNGVISAALAPGDILQSMMTSCAGTLFWGQGNWQLRPGYYTAPTKTFTLDDLRGPISLSTRTSRRDNFNIVRGTFNNIDSRWITQDYPEIRSTTFIAEDNGLENALDLELPLTTSPAMAQRLAKLTLFRGREQITFSADFSMEAFDVQVGDIIALTNPRYGWTAKEFEVLGWRFFADGDAGDLRVNLALRETSEAAFDWDAEESAIISNNTNLLSYTEVPPVGLSAVARTQIIREKLTNIIALTVTSGNPAGVDFVEAQYKKSSDSAYITLGTGELGVFEAIDLEDDSYDFRARAINAFGYRGEWEFLTGIEASGLLEPPQDVAGLFAEVNGTTTHLEWTPVPDLDLSFYRIRHAVETTGATWANSTTALDKVSRPASFASLPTRPGTYMVRSYDKSGVASTNFTSVVVPDAVVPDYANSLTQTDSPTFSGTKTGCSVTSSELRITDVSTAPTEATYDFSTYIDTGSVRRAHVRVDANVNRFDSSSGLWDDLPGLFDELPGLFDDFTGLAQFSDTNLLFYVSTTPDDPAGTPTWSDYQQFRAGEFYGRAFRFRVILKSSSVDVTPSISGLTALVEYN
jgi:hypothetical protein